MDLEEAISSAEEKFEKGRRTVGLFAGPIFFTLLLVLPIGGIQEPARRLAAVLVLCVIFWVTEAIPLPATALLGPALTVLLGVAPAKEALAPFGDPLLFLFVGSFLIAAAMSHHGLDRRIAFFILSRRAAGGSPARILTAFCLISAAISMWISNTATTAMILPVALGVLRAFSKAGERRLEGWPYASGLLLSVAFGASVGGIGTPVGTPPNIIGIGMIQKLTGRKIAFFEWMAFAVPTLLVLLPLLVVMLLLLHPAGRGSLKGATDYFRSESRRLGRWSRGEMAAALAFVLAVILWVTPGVFALALGSEDALAKKVAERLPEGPVALAAAAVLFFVPTDWPRRKFALDWKLAAGIDWGTVMLFGGGLSLGTMMFSTGLARSLGDWLVGSGGWSFGTYTALAVLAGILVSEATSNTASASMVVPVVIAIAAEQKIDPVIPALGACLGSSFGFALPVSTAPNALAYGTGLVPITRMLRAGLLLDLIGFLTIWGMLMLLRP